MRLREPLYGFRIASMHIVMHLCLLVSMMMIDLDWFTFDLGAIEDFDHS